VLVGDSVRLAVVAADVCVGRLKLHRDQRAAPAARVFDASTIASLAAIGALLSAARWSDSTDRHERVIETGPQTAENADLWV